jgi:hypothetical protein
MKDNALAYTISLYTIYTLSTKKALIDESWCCNLQNLVWYYGVSSVEEGAFAIIACG